MEQAFNMDTFIYHVVTLICNAAFFYAVGSDIYPQKKVIKWWAIIAFVSIVQCYTAMHVVPPQFQMIIFFLWAIALYCGGYWYIGEVGIGKTIFVFCNYLISILSNILENAVHGCKGSRDPFIHIDIQRKGTKLVIVCENSCSTAVTFADGIPQAKGRQGVGVSSVGYRAKLYEGESWFSQSNAVFTAKIWMNP